MSGLDLKKFAGKMPIAGHRTLPDHFATESINTWLYGGELRAIRPPVWLETINPGIKKIFRIPMRTPGGDTAWRFHNVVPPVVPPAAYLGDSLWWDMDDPDTDIVRSVLTNDEFERFYFCSPTHGLQYNTFERMQTGLSNYPVGIAPPTAAQAISSITVEAGTGATISRSYVITYQTVYGEESAPSPPTSASGATEARWFLHGIDTPGEVQVGGPDIEFLNIYRTITGASGTASYFRVAHLDVAGPSASVPDPYIDDTRPGGLPDTAAANNLPLDTVGWYPPPPFNPDDPTKPIGKLQGIVKMPNGFLVGWLGSDIFMSVPYMPHAWPVEYILSTEYPIVGMGVVGQTCVILTEGYPEALTGTDPISTSLTKLNAVEPCLSRGSIVTSLSGVWYASQNGLMVVSPGGVQNATGPIINRENWIKSYAPEYIRACRYQEGYLALRCYPDPAIRTAFYLDPTSLEVALTELTEFEYCENVMTDIWSGEVFKIDSQEVQHWDAPSDNLMPLVWRTKEFQTTTELNFGVYAIYWDHARFSPNDHSLDLIDHDVPVRFIAWQNRRQVYDANIPINKNGKPMRLPSGTMGDVWQFEIRARAPIYSLAIAQTEKELAGA